MKSPSSSRDTSTVNELENDDDNESKTIVRGEPLPTPSLKVKRIDNYYSQWSKTWKYRVSYCCQSCHHNVWALIVDIYIEHQLQVPSGDRPGLAK